MSDGELLLLVAGSVVMLVFIGLRASRGVVRIDPTDLEPTYNSGWLGLGILLVVATVIAGILLFYGGANSDLWLFSGLK